MTSLRLKITGMHCGHCRTTVERALRGVPGTFGVAVELQEGSAEIDFDPSRADAQQLIGAVRTAGYDAEIAP